VGLEEGGALGNAVGPPVGPALGEASSGGSGADGVEVGLGGVDAESVSRAFGLRSVIILLKTTPNSTMKVVRSPA
jgi:hypothetical protein